VGTTILAAIGIVLVAATLGLAFAIWLTKAPESWKKRLRARKSQGKALKGEFRI